MIQINTQLLSKNMMKFFKKFLRICCFPLKNKKSEYDEEAFIYDEDYHHVELVSYNDSRFRYSISSSMECFEENKEKYTIE